MPSSITLPKNRVRNANEWKTQYYGVTASQTFAPGDWVYLDSSGTLVIAAAASNDVGNVKLLGIAQAFADDCLDNSRDCPVLVPMHAGAQFMSAVYHSTGASAVIAATDLDVPLTLPLRNQGGNWMINLENNSTNDRVFVHERVPEYPFSEQYGTFWCSLIQNTTSVWHLNT